MLIAIATTSSYVCQAVIVDGKAGLKSCVSNADTTQSTANYTFHRTRRILGLQTLMHWISESVALSRF
jgi:hypothetical protein